MEHCEDESDVGVLLGRADDVEVVDFYKSESTLGGLENGSDLSFFL